MALGLVAGWIAAGSSGLLTASLQSLLVWLLLLSVALLQRPRFDLRHQILAAVVIAFSLLTPRAFGPTPFHLVLAVAAILGLIASGAGGIAQRQMQLATVAVLGLALFRIAQLQVPLVWLMSDFVGGQLGRVAHVLVGHPIDIGATFAGVDFLVIMALMWFGWLTLLRPPRRTAAVLAAACVLLAHGMYLIALVLTPHIAALLPDSPAPTFGNPYIPPAFCWSTVARQLLPWNLPFLAALLQAAVVVIFLRRAPWQPRTDTNAQRSKQHETQAAQIRTRLETAAPFALALLLPIICLLNTISPANSSNLLGKTVLVNDQDDLDFDVAQHDDYGQLSAGTFGLLPDFILSLGGHCHTTRQLTPEQIERADILILLHPAESFAAHKQLIWDYATQGGSVLIVTDGYAPEFGPETALAELLDGTAITSSQDTAVSETRNWDGAHQCSLHGATPAAGSSTTRFLSDHGTSLQLGWAARPLVVGQWGWSVSQPGANDTKSLSQEDQASEQKRAAEGETEPLRTGERLGDLVLAAEQQVGKGRLVVLGSNTPLTNEGLVISHAFVGNLLGYLAHDQIGPQAGWRQCFGLLGCLAIPFLLLRRPRALFLVWIPVVLTVGLGATGAWNRYQARVVPDGHQMASATSSNTPNGIAYIDQSHLEAYSIDDWGYESINGLTLNLMRNGYLPLMLAQVTAERLDGASLLFSIAPARAFSARERSAVKSFVQEGGHFICTVGAEQAAPSASLLSEFELRVPPSPLPTGGADYEPEPFGRTRSFYLPVEPEDGESYRVAIRLHAAWPVESTDDQTEVVAYARNQLRMVQSVAELPVVSARQCGDGIVIVIGDTSFAMNKNLEYIGGEPFDNDYENAHFWRWLITGLTGQPDWVPPRHVESKSTPTTEDQP